MFTLTLEYPALYFDEYEKKIRGTLGERKSDSGFNMFGGQRDIVSNDFRSDQELNLVVKALQDLKLPKLKIRVRLPE